jgi:hypothetical protein
MHITTTDSTFDQGADAHVPTDDLAAAMVALVAVAPGAGRADPPKEAVPQAETQSLPRLPTPISDRRGRHAGGHRLPGAGTDPHHSGGFRGPGGRCRWSAASTPLAAPADEIGALLTERLAGRYLKDPVITVMVKQAVSQRVTVDGAVVKPGVYNLSGPTSLLQALALANGPDPRVANLRKVAIFRSVEGVRRGEVFDLAKIRNGKAPDPQVRGDDIIVVDASGTRSFFAYFGSSLPLLSLFRPY